MENESRTNNYEIWLRNYEILIDLLRTEGDRFWTRWNLLSIVETALIGTSTLFFSNENLIYPKIILSLFVFSLGIITGIIWYKLTNSGEKWQMFFVDSAITMENSHSELEPVFLRVYDYEKRFPILKYAKLIPIVFTIIFAILFIVFIILFFN